MPISKKYMSNLNYQHVDLHVQDALHAVELSVCRTQGARLKKHPRGLSFTSCHRFAKKREDFFTHKPADT
jgi:hypothetical protein